MRTASGSVFRVTERAGGWRKELREVLVFYIRAREMGERTGAVCPALYSKGWRS